LLTAVRVNHDGVGISRRSGPRVMILIRVCPDQSTRGCSHSEIARLDLI
jgi:hypothetical protein